MKQLIFIQIIFFLSFSLFAQSVKTDYGIYPPPSPPPALPAKGYSFIDPTFGTSILRVTDAGDGADNHQSYSYWPSLNKNSSLLYISSVGGNPTLYDFDTTAFSISNKRAMFQSNPPGGEASSAEDAIWSGKQNNVMLCHTSQKLWKYDVSTNQYALIHDFAAAYPNIFLWQMSRSVNDSVFAFTYKDNVTYNVVGYITYKIAGNQTDTAQMPGLDEVQLDKSGKYLVIKTGNAGGPSAIEVEVLNLNTKVKQSLTDGSPDFAPGHSDNGTGFVIGADNWNNMYTYRNLAAPHAHYPVIDFANDWTLGNHVSMLCDNESWMLMSTFVASTLPSSGIFKDEIFQFSTDGTKKVRRLAHTHSNYLNQSSADKYWSSPRANISRDGKYAVFTSNWGSTARRDVFVLKIPSPVTTDIPENQLSLFSISPNPSGDYMNLKFSCNQAGEKIKTSILNSVGQVFLEREFFLDQSCGFNMSIETLPPGIYFIAIQGDKGRVVQKFSCVR